MYPGKRPPNSIACNLVGPFQPKGLMATHNTNMHMPSQQLPYSNIHTLLICINSYASISKTYICTFRGPLTMVTDNGKEFKNDLVQKVAKELDIKHKFSSQ